MLALKYIYHIASDHYREVYIYHIASDHYREQIFPEKNLKLMGKNFVSGDFEGYFVYLFISNS